VLNLLGIQTDDYEYTLINDLLKDYNIYARPTTDFNLPTNVTFGLSLSQLIDVVNKLNFFGVSGCLLAIKL